VVAVSRGLVTPKMPKTRSPDMMKLPAKDRRVDPDGGDRARLHVLHVDDPVGTDRRPAALVDLHHAAAAGA
jgi:hypothetical protein